MRSKKIILFTAAAVAVLLLAAGIWTYHRSQSAGQESAPPAATASPPAPDQTLYPYYTLADKQIWGYMNVQGQPVIQPAYESAGLFNEQEIAKVGIRENDKTLYGLIDRSGQYVLKPQYSELLEEKEGIIIAKTENDASLLLDSHGKLVKEVSGNVSSFQGGMAAVRVGKKYGYIDKTGNVVISPSYHWAGAFQGDKALIQKAVGSYTLINARGESLLELKSVAGNSYADGLFAAKSGEKSKWGYRNEQGETVIPEQFEHGEAFHEGRAVVAYESYGRKTGLIDDKGAFIIPAEYGQIEYVGASLWAVARYTWHTWHDIPDIDQEKAPFKYALFDRDGKQLTEFIFDSISSYKDGRAVATQELTTLFIDGKGQRVADLPVIEGVGELKQVGTLISANVDNRLKYVTPQGKVVWQASYQMPLDGDLVLKEAKLRPHRNVLYYYPVLEGVKDPAVSQRINSAFNSRQTMDLSESEFADSQGSFTLTMFRKDLLVIEFSSYDYPFGAAHGMPGEQYTHVNVRTGEQYQLPDLFLSGQAYLDVIGKRMKEQIEHDRNEMGMFPNAVEEFNGITAEQPFYIMNDTLHLYYHPYEIGSYAAGFITFRIPLADLDGVINKQGEFWKSFH